MKKIIKVIPQKKNNPDGLTAENKALRKSLVQNELLIKNISSNLEERKKELQFQYELTEIISNPNIDSDSVIKKIIELLPNAFQYPDKAVAYIKIGGKEYKSRGYKDYKTNLIYELPSKNKSGCSIKVCYKGIKGIKTGQAFLKEEMNLLKATAKRLVKYYDYYASENALRQSNAQYRYFVENIAEVIYDITLDGIIKYVSPKIKSITGYEPDEIIGKKFFDYVHKDDLPGVIEKIKNIGIDKYRSLEYRFITKTDDVCWVRTSTNPVFEKRKIVGGTGVLINITERKQAEEQLKESENLRQAFFDAAPEVFTITDLEGKVEYSSPKAREMFGVEDESVFIGRNLLEFIDPSDHEKAINGISLMFNGQFERAEHYNALKRDGTRFDIEVSGQFIKDDNGNPKKMIFVTRDISKRIETEKQLQSTKELFRKMVESVNDVLYDVSAEGTINYVSPAITRILGYQPEELIGKNFFHYMYPEDRPHLIKALQELGKRDYSYLEYRYYTKSGDLRWVRSSTSPVYENGIMVGGRGSLTDIHEKKLAEEKLKRSEENTRHVIESSPIGIITLNDKGEILSNNRAFTEITGYDKNDIPNVDAWWTAVYPDEVYRETIINRWISEVEKYKKGEKFRPVEGRIRCKNGEYKHIETLMASINESSIVTFIDITERINSEDQLRIQKEKLEKNEQVLKEAQDIALMGYWELDVVNNILFWSDDVYKIFGCEPQEFGATYEALLNFIYPDDRNKVNDAYSNHLKTKEDYDITHRIITKKNEIKYMHERCRTKFDGEGKPLYSLGVVFDVTKQIQYETKLAESRQFLIDIIENSDSLIYVKDINGIYKEVNSKWTKLLGIKKEDTLGKTDHQIFDKEIADQFVENDLKVLKSGESVYTEEILKTPEGIRYFLSSKFPVLDNSGNVTSLCGMSTEVTHIRKAEAELRTREESLRNLVNSQTNFVLRTDLKGKHTYWNQKFEEEFGWVYGDGIDGGDSLQSICNYHHQRTQEAVEKCFAEPGKIIKVELDKPAKDGGTRTTLWEFVCLTDKDNKPSEIQCMGIDITDRVMMEKSLLESEEKFRTLFNTMPNGYYKTTPEGYFVDANPAYIKMLGYESMDELKTLYIPEAIYVNSADREEIINDNSGFVDELETYRLKTKQGKIIWVEDNARYIKDENGKVIFFEGICRDITERISAEKKILESEKNYKTLFYDSPQACAIIKDGSFIDCNLASSRLIGLDREELIGKSPVDFSPQFQPNGKSSKDYAEELLSEAFRKGKNSFEWIHTRADGSQFIAFVELSRIVLNNEDVIFVLWQDITTKKKDEEEIRKLSRAVDQSPVSIVITNLDGNIEYANKKACETTGYTLEELIGQNPRVLKSGETSEGEYKTLWKNISEGKEWNGIFHNKRKNGEMYWESSRIAPIFDSKGKITHYLAVKEDITERKRIEEALSVSDRRFRQVAEHTRTVIWEVDKDGLYTYVSPIVESVWGYKVEELIGKKYFYQLHPEDIQEEFKAAGLDLIKSGKEIKQFDNPILKKDNSIMWVSTNGTPIYDEKKNITGYRGADFDVTERKLAEEESKKFRMIADRANYGNAIADLEGNLVYCNESFAKMHGYEVSEILNKNLAMLHSKEQLIKVTESIQLLQKEGQFSANEIWRTRKDGTAFPSLMNAMVLFDDKNRPQFMWATAIDIAEIKNAQKELQIREAQLNHAQEIAKMGSWEFNIKTGKVTWSKNYYMLVGADPDTPPLPLEEIKKMVHPEDAALFETKMADITKSHTLKTIYFRFIMPDKSIKWIQAYMIPVFEGDELISINGVSIDITDRKRAEQEIIDLNTNLEKKVEERTHELAEAILVAENANKAKSEFLSRMSHELRTPMNSILGFAQLLDMGQLDERQKRAVHHILKSGHHLLELINEVLDISRIEAGKISLSMEPVDVHNLINEMIDTVSTHAHSRKIEIKLIKEIDGLHVKADMQRLKQVFLNLLNNAVKYNKEGGEVLIKSELKEPDENGIENVRVSVIDTGYGIPEEDISKLFTPFERIGADKTETVGTGLGLSVVKRLIDLMGGKVGVYSKIGEGTTFWFELPKTEGQITRIKNNGDLEKVKVDTLSHHGNILYIEDNLSNIELVEQVLSSSRPEIKLFTSLYGAQAVELAIHHKPDFILLDLNLPDIHGRDVLSKLKRDKRTSGIPVVVISADAMQSQIEKLIEIGAADYLTKPIDINSFLKVLDKLIKK